MSILLLIIVFVLLAPCLGFAKSKGFSNRYIEAAIFLVIFILAISYIYKPVHSIFGEVSSCSFVLAFALLRSKQIKQTDEPKKGEVALVLRICAIIAVPLYASSLTGIGPDLYSLGYGNGLLVLATGAVAMLALVKGLNYLSIWLWLALAITALNLHESSNFWDHLVDLPSALAGIVAWIMLFLSKKSKKDADKSLEISSDSDTITSSTQSRT